MHQLTAFILLSTSSVHSKVHHLVVAQPPVVLPPDRIPTSCQPLHLEITPRQAGRRSAGDRHTERETLRERQRRSQVTSRDAEDVLRDASWRLRPPVPSCGRSWSLLLRVESLTDVVRERQTVSPPPLPPASMAHTTQAGVTPHPPSPTPPPPSVDRRGRKPWQASKPREVS